MSQALGRPTSCWLGFGIGKTVPLSIPDKVEFHMSYGLNLGWGRSIGGYIGFWGGPMKGYAANLVQGSYHLSASSPWRPNRRHGSLFERLYSRRAGFCGYVRFQEDSVSLLVIIENEGMDFYL